MLTKQEQRVYPSLCYLKFLLQYSKVGFPVKKQCKNKVQIILSLGNRSGSSLISSQALPSLIHSQSIIKHMLYMLVL